MKRLKKRGGESMSKLTSVSKTLLDIKSEVEQNRQLLVQDLKKESKKELAQLSDNLSQKEKTDYVVKVQPHFDQIYKMVSKGYKKSDIAEVLGVTQVAFRNMCREISELKSVLEIGTEDKIDAVESSLYQLAMGYEYDEQVINGFDGSKEVLTRYQAPVLGAIKYVLGNKRGEEYADKRQIIKKVELGSDIREALMSITVDDLKMALTMADAKDNAIDADFTEKAGEVND